MKAIHLIKYGASKKAFDIREIDIPKPGPREVTIKVQAFGLNFADVVARNGLYPDAPKNPAVLGYDVAGHIHEVGSEVKNFKVGDRVTALTRFGGYAEYAKTMVEGVAKIPDDTDIHLATALATQACTAYFAAEHCVSMNEGDNVLIQAAAGGVGTILVQLAKHRKCTVFGTASESKLDYLKNSGVDYPINYRKEDFSKAIKNILGGNKLDFVFDSLGGRSFKKGWKLLQPGGTMVNFGAADQIGGSNIIKSIGVAAGFGIFSPLQLLMSSKSMVAINMLRIADNKPKTFQKTFEGVIKMTEEGIIQPTLAKVYKADQIADAHEFLESRQSIGKIVLEW